MSEPRTHLSAAERALVEALRGLRYGAVEAVVHDGRVVRIERREKVRIEDDPDAGDSAAPNAEPNRERPDRRGAPVNALRGER